MMESDARSGWVLSLSLVGLLLLLAFAAMMVYVADAVEGRGPDPLPTVENSRPMASAVQARLDAAMGKNQDLEKQLSEMDQMVNELKTLVGAKETTKESFQVAIGNLKRGYVLCQQGGNTLIEATVEHGEETVAVIGDIPSDMRVNLKQGEHTSDLEEIVSFLQDVYQYEKDRNCRFNYRLKAATEDDRRLAKEGFGKYLYPEK